MIELIGVSKAYGSKRVLHRLDLVVEDGSLVWLSGASGGGKSTLLGIAALLIGADEGTVVIDGVEHDLARHRALVRSARGRRVGFMPQAPLLFGELSAAQNVMLAAPRNDRRDARQRLADVGLRSAAKEHASMLSGGQQHRASLARALVNAPANLVADEPTASLDDDNAAIVGDLLATQARAGKAVLVASHDSRMGPFATHRVRLESGVLR